MAITYHFESKKELTSHLRTLAAENMARAADRSKRSHESIRLRAEASGLRIAVSLLENSIIGDMP